MKAIKVTGRGVLKVPPDTTRLTFTLEGTYSEYADAFAHSGEDTENLKDTLETLGFLRKALKTLSFNIEAKYKSYLDENKNYQQRFLGYQFSHVMKLEFANDNDLLGKTLYAVAHSGLNPKILISYTVKDPETVKNELLDKAVKDATAKAEALTRAAGLSLGEIQTIDYSWGKIDLEYKPVKTDEWASLFTIFPTERSRSLNIEPDNIEVSDTVTVVWEIS